MGKYSILYMDIAIKCLKDMLYQIKDMLYQIQLSNGYRLELSTFKMWLMELLKLGLNQLGIKLTLHTIY